MYNNRYKKRRVRFPVFPLVLVALLLLLGVVVMLLWNAILPQLLHVNNITYGQSVGLLLLCRILFGGFRFGSPGYRKPFGSHNPWREKWMHMSDEDKAKFKNEWRQRCHPRSPQFPQPPEQKAEE